MLAEDGHSLAVVFPAVKDFQEAHLAKAQLHNLVTSFVAGEAVIASPAEA